MVMELRRRRRRLRRPSTPSPAEVAAAAAAAAMSLVLDDDDLLGEILLRVAFPTTLVRAALTCKRWLRVASGRDFLLRFRALHPPRLLGFYTNGGFGEIPEFWPVRHPPELAPAVRRAAAVFGAFPGSFVSIADGRRDGRLLVRFVERDAVLSPLLFPARDVTFLRSPKPALGLGVRYCSSKLLPEHSCRGPKCWELLQIQRHGQLQTTVQISKLHRGAWRHESSVETELLGKMNVNVELSGGKFYITSSEKNIVVLDQVSSTCSAIDVPENVDGDWLSKANDSGVYLISVTESLHLCIWLHQIASDSLSNWFLRDTICLRTVFAGLGMAAGPIRLCCVGENIDFVLLEMGGSIFYFDIHSRTIEKLFQKAPGDTFRPFFPLMMIWPPSFPAHILEE